MQPSFPPTPNGPQMRASRLTAIPRYTCPVYASRFWHRKFWLCRRNDQTNISCCYMSFSSETAGKNSGPGLPTLLLSCMSIGGGLGASCRASWRSRDQRQDLSSVWPAPPWTVGCSFAPGAERARHVWFYCNSLSAPQMLPHCLPMLQVTGWQRGKARSRERMREPKTVNRVSKWWRHKHDFDEIMGFFQLFGTTCLNKVHMQKTGSLEC